MTVYRYEISSHSLDSVRRTVSDPVASHQRRIERQAAVPEECISAARISERNRISVDVAMEVCAPHHTDRIFGDEPLQYRVVVSGPVEVEPRPIVFPSGVLVRVRGAIRIGAKLCCLAVGRVGVVVLHRAVVLGLGKSAVERIRQQNPRPLARVTRDRLVEVEAGEKADRLSVHDLSERLEPVVDVARGHAVHRAADAPVERVVLEARGNPRYADGDQAVAAVPRVGGEVRGVGALALLDEVAVVVVGEKERLPRGRERNRAHAVGFVVARRKGAVGERAAARRLEQAPAGGVVAVGE